MPHVNTFKIDNLLKDIFGIMICLASGVVSRRVGDPEVTSRSSDANKYGIGVNDLLTLSPTPPP